MDSVIDWAGVPLSHNHIATMLAKLNSSGMARICFHENEKSGLHVMLIAISPYFSYPIHRHMSSDEWYLVIHGKLYIGSYDYAGKQLDSNVLIPPVELHLTSACKGGLLMKSGTFHNAATLGEGALFLEIRPGPFIKADTQYLTNLTKDE